MAIYVEEFLYRGRAPEAADPPAWHLQLTSVGTDDFGAPIRSTRTLNMSQAAEAGWALPDIIAAINADALREVETAQARAEALEISNADLSAALAARDARIAELQAGS